MNEVKQLESLSESIDNEIEELQSLLEKSDSALLKTKKSSFQKQLSNIISNLESANNSVYGVFEELNHYDIERDIERLENDYNILHEILQEKLTHEEKVDIRIKYGINL